MSRDEAQNALKEISEAHGIPIGAAHNEAAGARILHPHSLLHAAMKKIILMARAHRSKDTRCVPAFKADHA
jgi:hypothetical protein